VLEKVLQEKYCILAHEVSDFRGERYTGIRHFLFVLKQEVKIEQEHDNERDKSNGHFEAVFSVVTNANVGSVSIRALETDGHDAGTHILTTLANGQRQWTVRVVINGWNSANATRFEVEGIDGGGFQLPNS